MSWFGSLGEAVVDGGSPFGPACSISSDGAVTSDPGSRLTGYSIISADSLDEAVTKAKGCPALTSGGQVDVYESISMG